jgi:hypothetical protein
MDAAWADNWIWKFKIPVELKQIPSKAQNIKISLQILTEKNQTMASHTTDMIPIKPDGTLSEVVEITIYEYQIKSEFTPVDAVKYKAAFVFAQSPVKMFIPNTKPIPWTMPMPGTKLVYEIEGPMEIKDLKIFPGALKGKK